LRKNATVVEVLISSPGDLKTTREKCQQAITQWNLTHGREKNIFLEAILWESHASSEYGDRPQGLLNRQIVDRSDMAIVLFWTRFGTPTGKADSGTVEELEHFAETGKPCLVYFCTADCSPTKIDADQLSKLNHFKSKLRKNSLTANFNSDDELLSLLNRDISNAINQLSLKDVIPEAIQSYLLSYPVFSTQSEIEVQFVRTSRQSFFSAIKEILSTLKRGEIVKATDSLNRSREMYLYWCTEGLRYLEMNHSASRRIKLKRIFIVSRKELESHPSYIQGICEIHSMAGVDCSVVIYEKLPEECLLEFVVFGNYFVSEVTYDFRSERIIENKIHWSKQKIQVFSDKFSMIESFEEHDWQIPANRAQRFQIIAQQAKEFMIELQNS
jgi:hypothetical protein